ncbi:uncharacterized protein LOC126703778 [Quercus robur]|uniref:uncharacterized protein LOC126703778 n=1 Tax=Quercus robur TaxID=38942 RepID=UPI002161A268|nr:uncharacterized protein LOC126703778 [Quercus robur]
MGDSSKEKKRLREAENSALQGNNVELVTKLKGELVGLLVKKEQMWQQRSKTHWLKLGDKNSKFFHTKASQRFRRNRILGIEDHNGVWCVGEEKVAEVFENYYSSLFTTSNPNGFEEVTQHVGRVVNEEMNKELIGDFSRGEVERALNQMAPLKAPGPDGMPPIFYQHYWRNIGDDVTDAVLFCLNTGKIPTDDSLLFCHAKVEEVKSIQTILEVYEKALGQQINAEKTTFFFGKAVREKTKNSIKVLLGVPEIKHYEKYLGLPAVVGKNRRASLNYIKDRVWGKLQGWKEKLLSQAGKEVLLKAVVQAIPTFAMGCFKLPIGLCKDIEMLIRKFWWGQPGERRKIHWKNWDTLCKPKIEGGLRFKDLAKFNDVMLAKQVWRLSHDTSSLFYRVFKARYFPNGTIFYAKQKSDSYAWKSILRVRKVMVMGAKWRVGDGKSIKVFVDNWLPGSSGGKVTLV